MIEILAQSKELTQGPKTKILLGKMNKKSIIFLVIMTLNFLQTRDLLTFALMVSISKRLLGNLSTKTSFIHFSFSKSLLLGSP